MSDTESSFYTARARVEKVEGVHRRVHVAGDARFDVGVHGPIKEHYRLHDQPDLPLPVDIIVGAAGA